MSPTSYRTAPPRVTLKNPDDSIALPTMSPPSPIRPSFADIQDAARQIAGVATAEAMRMGLAIEPGGGYRVGLQMSRFLRNGNRKLDRDV